MGTRTVSYLIIPGWRGSADDHWQSHWQRCLPGALRVEQDDWCQPDPRAWVTRLEEAVRQSATEVIFIAHSLGCITVAQWAASASGAVLGKVRGALLVAPADVERPGCPEALRGFAPIARQRLPFPSQLIGSSNDPAATVARALQLSRDWGSEAAFLQGAGHINVDSGHRRWEQGFAHLYRLQQLIEDHGRRRA